MNLSEIVPNDVYVITNLDAPLSSGERCTCVYGRDVNETLNTFRWTNFEIREAIATPLSREPTSSEKESVK
jgi:hypothetical protein